MAPALSPEEYHVGWICALSIEMAAAMAMLDEKHEKITGQDPQDHNSYCLGRVHDHNVVIACLPAGVYGTTPAATVAKDMLRTFKELRFGLMVGIGGGIPDLEKGIDIRLGDIVVSQPTDTNGGVIQYDRGKHEEGGLMQKGILNTPPSVLLTALNFLQAEHDLEESQVMTYLSTMFERHPRMKDTGYAFPGVEHDRLYRTTYPHPGGLDACNQCDPAEVVERKPRPRTTAPLIHYGVIASGNRVIKNAAEREEIRKKYGAKSVEMEAAGLMKDFPCLVVRGVCDYADSHKNDWWQKYAAVAAAAYAKELLFYVSAEKTWHEKPIQLVAGK